MKFGFGRIHIRKKTNWGALCFWRGAPFPVAEKILRDLQLWGTRVLNLRWMRLVLRLETYV